MPIPTKTLDYSRDPIVIQNKELNPLDYSRVTVSYYRQPQPHPVICPPPIKAKSFNKLVRAWFKRYVTRTKLTRNQEHSLSFSLQTDPMVQLNLNYIHRHEPDTRKHKQKMYEYLERYSERYITKHLFRVN